MITIQKLFLLTFIVLCINYKSHSQGFTLEKPDSTTIYYQIITQRTKQLKLKKLEQGSPKTEIRVWTIFELRYFNDLVVLSQNDTSWQALYYPHISIPGTKNTPDKLKFAMVSLHPVNGWNTLLKTLHDNHVFSLPDMDKINGLVDNWEDGTTYIVEVATPTMYRFYRYHLPEKFSDKFQQAQQMVNIVSAVEETFMLKKQRKQQERLLRK